MVGVENVVVPRVVLVVYGLGAVEEGEFPREVGVLVEAEERVDVDREWCLVVVEEPHDLDHEVPDIAPEVAIRGRVRG